MKSERAVTMLVLVITIIILLVIAGLQYRMLLEMVE